MEFWRGGRVVDCGGLENRCAERHPGFESLSLRNKGCKSSFCEIYTRFLRLKIKSLMFLRNIQFTKYRIFVHINFDLE